MRKILAIAALAVGLTALVPSSAAFATPVHPDGHGIPSNCGGEGKTYDSYGTTHVTLSVYKTAGKTKVGSVHSGNWFCYKSSSGKLIGQTYWVDGFGYASSGNNGSKVTGWVNDYYIAG